MTIEKLLTERYPSNAFAVLFEVRNAAGFAASRSCDALAVGLWPSRGLTVDGFEIKRSRADWLREFKAPEKAEAFVKYCDRWWIVADNDKVVELAELPEPWGLLVVKRTEKTSKLVVVKEAPRLTPEPITRSFLAALVKRAAGAAKDATEDQLRAARTEGAEQARLNDRQEAKWATEQHTALQNRVRAFEAASGLQIEHGWTHPGETGQIVKAVLAQKHSDPRGRLEAIRDQLKRLVDEVEKSLAAVPVL